MRYLIALCVAVFASCASAQTELIVRLQPNVDPVSLAVRYGVPLIDTTPKAPFALYGIPSNVDPDVLQSEFSSDGDVVWAEDNEDVGTADGQSAIKGSGIPAIGGRNALYAINKNLLKQIDWNSSVANSKGRQVKIAILDTGLSRKQGYLWKKVDASVNYVERGWIADDIPIGYDTRETGHGTMIAGLVDEISPNTRLVIARVADSGGVATAWTLILGLAFAVDNGAEVANISLGSPHEIPALEDVIDWCDSNNLLVVAGIGNLGSRNALFPARYETVACVAGLNADNTKASFSNWDGRTTSSAPATGIVSQWWDGRMGIWAGTSFSSPMVAASVADGLRHTSGPVPPSALRIAIKRSGRNIDGLNKAYQGQLGTLLDYQRLNVLVMIATNSGDALSPPARNGWGLLTSR
ncbi:MAG: S8 family peptidase [Fimbriimonadales bacterium]